MRMFLVFAWLVVSGEVLATGPCQCVDCMEITDSPPQSDNYTNINFYLVNQNPPSWQCPVDWCLYKSEQNDDFCMCSGGSYTYNATCTGPTIPVPDPCSSCPRSEYDSRCHDPSTDDEHGGLGCMACGNRDCRFCGFDHFPACSGESPPSLPPTVTAQPVGGSDDVMFTIINRCSQTLWIGAEGRSNSKPSFPGTNVFVPNNGGWELAAGTNDTVPVPWDFTAGRFWARTGCTGIPGEDFHCETGDCGPWVECATGQVARGGEPPVSLAEFTLNDNNKDYFDISFVDGFNLPMTINVITPDTSQPNPEEYWCTSPTCTFDINSECPPELMKLGKDGVVACYSACSMFNTDEYCCRGYYATPETCNPDKWPEDYSQVFGAHCPQAYSFAYDDNTSTFTCRNTDYHIVFC